MFVSPGRARTADPVINSPADAILKHGETHLN